MAEKTERKKADNAAPGSGAPAPHGEEKKAAGGSMIKSTPVLLGVAMIVEAAVLFAGFKFLGGGPKTADAGVATTGGHGGSGKSDDEKGGPKSLLAELSVVDIKAQNKQRGRTFLYDVSIVAVVKTEKAEATKKAIEANAGRVRDRIRTIIAQTDPEKLDGGNEPGLETLRRQVKYQLDEIIGEGIIDEVLVPKCIPYRADF